MGTMGTLSLSHKCFRIVPAMKLLGTVFGGIDGGPPLFTLLQPEMPTTGARNVPETGEWLCRLSWVHLRIKRALVATKLSGKVLRVIYWLEALMFADLPAEHCFRVDLTDLISRGNHSHFPLSSLSLPFITRSYIFCFLVSRVSGDETVWIGIEIDSLAWISEFCLITAKYFRIELSDLIYQRSPSHFSLSS